MVKISNLDYFLTRNEIIVAAFQRYISGIPTFKMNPSQTRGEGVIPLLLHPLHGETCLRFIEKYNKEELIHYHYGWELLAINNGVKSRQIIVFGSEPHTKVQTDTEPYHHNHIPGEPKQRQACYTIRSLRDVMSLVVNNYIQTGNPYTPILI